jgi:hypothetical protein
MEPELPRPPDVLGQALHHGALSQSAHVPRSQDMVPRRVTTKYSVTGARLDLQWRQLTNVEYLTDGGNSWIHTGVFEDKSVVVKTLKPECQDVVLAINEIESELGTFVSAVATICVFYFESTSAMAHSLYSCAREIKSSKHCQPHWRGNY